MRDFLDRFVGNISPSALMTSVFFWSWFDLVPFSDLIPTALGRTPDLRELALSLLCGSLALAALAVIRAARVRALRPTSFAAVSLALGCGGTVMYGVGTACGLIVPTVLGCALTGLYQGAGALVIGCLVVCQGKTNALVHMASCLPFNIVFVLLGMYLRPVAGVVLCALLPALAALSYAVFMNRGHNAQLIMSVKAAGTRAQRLGYMPYVILLLVICASFGFVNCRAQALGAPTTSGGSYDSYTAYASLFIRALAALFVFLEYVTRSRQPYALLVAAIALMSGGMLALGLAGDADQRMLLASSWVVYAGYAIFDLLVWALMVIVHHRSRMPMRQFVCVAYSVDELGNALGTYLGTLPPDLLGTRPVCGALGVALVTIAFAVLSQHTALREDLRFDVVGTGATSLRRQHDGGSLLTSRQDARRTRTHDKPSSPDAAASLRDACGDERATGAAVPEGLTVEAASSANVARATNGAVVPSIAASARLIASRFFLTGRERETLELLLAGRSVPYIAEQQCVSQNTVKTHVRHIYVKLDVHSRQELLDLLENPCA